MTKDRLEPRISDPFQTAITITPRSQLCPHRALNGNYIMRHNFHSIPPNLPNRTKIAYFLKNKMD